MLAVTTPVMVKPMNASITSPPDSHDVVRVAVEETFVGVRYLPVVVDAFGIDLGDGVATRHSGGVRQVDRCDQAAGIEVGLARRRVDDAFAGQLFRAAAGGLCEEEPVPPHSPSAWI